MQTRLSIIIPTYNRAYYLKNLILKIINDNLNTLDFEILVIDNNSSDNTKEVVLECKKQFSTEIKYFFEPKQGLHEGRHRGLRESNSDILIFIDDDIEPNKLWLTSIFNAFKNPEVVLVGGRVIPKFKNNYPKWMKHFWDLDSRDEQTLGTLSLVDLGNEIKEISPHFVFGCNFAVRKNLLLETSGFHPDGFPEKLIMYRGDGETFVSEYISIKGYKTLYTPDAMIYHIIPTSRCTIKYFCKRAFNQGISDSYTQIRSGIISTNPELLKLIIRSLLYITKDSISRISIFKYSSYTAFYINVTSRISYLKGFIQHHNATKKDPVLMNWIHKENYLNEI
jgi:glycosyltransferase involved in cell wall biosynthesis